MPSPWTYLDQLGRAREQPLDQQCTTTWSRDIRADHSTAGSGQADLAQAWLPIIPI